MNPPPDDDAWSIARRCIAITLYSGGAGMATGAISGTVVPFVGTIVGAGVGCVVGVVVSVVVAPLLLRRELRRAFGLMLIWSMSFSGAGVLAAWVSAYSGYDRYLAEVYTYGAVPGAVLVYLGGAVWAFLKHPVGWPRVSGSGCVRCGYSLVGLVSWVCPECGTDNEPKRLAQPE